jgi:hypothetical protein
MRKLKFNFDVDLPNEIKGNSKRRKRVKRKGKARDIKQNTEKINLKAHNPGSGIPFSGKTHDIKQNTEKIHLKAHNPGSGIPFSHTPLIIEKPNIEQANKVTLLNQQLETQTKKLIDNDNKVGQLLKENDELLKDGYNKVGNLIKSLKEDNANKISKIENKLEKKIEVVVKKSYIDERNKLKEKYKELGGNNPEIILSSRKATIEKAIKDLEREKYAGLTENENIYSGILTPTSGSLFTAIPQSETTERLDVGGIKEAYARSNEPDMSLANLYDDRSSSPVMKDVEENIPTVRKYKRNKK